MECSSVDHFNEERKEVVDKQFNDSLNEMTNSDPESLKRDSPLGGLQQQIQNEMKKEAFEKISRENYDQALQSYKESEGFFLNYGSFIDAAYNVLQSCPLVEKKTENTDKINQLEKIQKTVNWAISNSVELAGEIKHLMTILRFLEKQCAMNISDIKIFPDGDKSLMILREKSMKLIDDYSKSFEKIQNKWISKTRTNKLKNDISEELMFDLTQNIKIKEVEDLFDEIQGLRSKMKEDLKKFEINAAKEHGNLRQVKLFLAEKKSKLVFAEFQNEYYKKIRIYYDYKLKNLDQLLSMNENNLLENLNKISDFLKQKTNEMEENERKFEDSKNISLENINSQFEMKKEKLIEQLKAEREGFRNEPTHITEKFDEVSFSCEWFSIKKTKEITVENEKRRLISEKIQSLNEDLNQLANLKIQEKDEIVKSIEEGLKSRMNSIGALKEAVQSDTKYFRKNIEKMKTALREEKQQIEEKIKLLAEKIVSFSSEKEKSKTITDFLSKEKNDLESKMKKEDADFEKKVNEMDGEIVKKMKRIQEYLKLQGHESEKSYIIFAGSIVYFIKIMEEFQTKVRAVETYIDCFGKLLAKKKIAVKNSNIDLTNFDTKDKFSKVQAFASIFNFKKLFVSNSHGNQKKIITSLFEEIKSLCNFKTYNKIEKGMALISD